MNTTVLKLNADYTAIGIIPWPDAIELILGQKASLVEAVPDRQVRSEHLVLPMPSIVALRRYKQVRGRVKFSGKHVILRDLGRCSYCGMAPKFADGRIDARGLTLDHVVPRAQAQHGAVYLPWAKRWVNVTSWENATTACKACNSAKADRTPDQAGMRLLVTPRTPTQADVLRIALGRQAHVPEAWRAYLPGALA